MGISRRRHLASINLGASGPSTLPAESVEKAAMIGSHRAITIDWQPSKLRPREIVGQYLEPPSSIDGDIPSFPWEISGLGSVSDSSSAHQHTGPQPFQGGQDRHSQPLDILDGFFLGPTTLYRPLTSQSLCERHVPSSGRETERLPVWK